MKKRGLAAGGWTILALAAGAAHAQPPYAEVPSARQVGPTAFEFSVHPGQGFTTTFSASIAEQKVKAPLRGVSCSAVRQPDGQTVLVVLAGTEVLAPATTTCTLDGPRGDTIEVTVHVVSRA